jgi:hypothetical protein
MLIGICPPHLTAAIHNLLGLTRVGIRKHQTRFVIYVYGHAKLLDKSNMNLDLFFDLEKCIYKVKDIPQSGNPGHRSVFPVVLAAQTGSSYAGLCKAWI